MKMKKLIFALLCAFAAVGMSAQDKYCYSYADFKADKWEELDTIVISERNSSWRYWSGDSDYKVKTGMKSFDKLMDKKVRVVLLRSGALYVNCRGLKVDGYSFGNGYSRGYRFQGDKILFEANRNDAEGVEMQDRSGYLGSVLGQVERSCYILDSDSKKVTRVTELYMEQLLLGYPDQLKKYRFLDNDEKETARSILPILKNAKLIE